MKKLQNTKENENTVWRKQFGLREEGEEVETFEITSDL